MLQSQRLARKSEVSLDIGCVEVFRRDPKIYNRQERCCYPQIDLGKVSCHAA